MNDPLLKVENLSFSFGQKEVLKGLNLSLEGGVETALAMLWTVDTLYPDYASGIDLDREIREFYSLFFGMTVDDGTIARIKDGSGMRAPKGE